MKIVRYRDDSGNAQYGILDGQTVFAATGELFQGLNKGDEVGAVDAVRLLPPIVPGKIVCVGLNYAAHVTESDANRAIPDEPVLFMKPTSALIGPDETIVIANPQNKTDYEAELVVVIGKRAHKISEADAPNYILGYTCGNDVSDRVLQQKDGQWVRAKGFDTYCPVGPCIETEFDVSNAPVRSRLNGEQRQAQTTASMIFNPHALVSFISNVMTLEPGDLVFTGTPEGVGAMKDGDTIEVEVGGIGVLQNAVRFA